MEAILRVRQRASRGRLGRAGGRKGWGSTALRGATSTPPLLGPWQVPSIFVLGPIFIMILMLLTASLARKIAASTWLWRGLWVGREVREHGRPPSQPSSNFLA